MDQPESDHQQAEAFRRGDVDALREVIERYGGEINRLMRLYTHREDLAEDLTQEVFLRAFTKRHLLVRTNNFRAWLLTIARHIAAKEMKRHRYRLEIPLEDFAPAITERMPDEKPSSARQLHNRQTRELLIEAINTLEEEERELITYRYFLDMPLREIADLLEIPMGSIGGKLQRALAAVRGHLESRNIRWDDLAPLE
jgi:RNA polymerase sigma-70 factor (ECF subfamily)